MSKAYAKAKAEEKKKNSSASSQQSSYQKMVSIYESQRQQDIAEANRLRNQINVQQNNRGQLDTLTGAQNYYGNIEAYKQKLQALRGYGYNTSDAVNSIGSGAGRMVNALQNMTQAQYLQQVRFPEKYRGQGIGNINLAIQRLSNGNAQQKAEAEWLKQHRTDFLSEAELRRGIRTADAQAQKSRMAALGQQSPWTDATLTPAQQAERYRQQQQNADVLDNATRAAAKARASLETLKYNEALGKLSEAELKQLSEYSKAKKDAGDARLATALQPKGPSASAAKLMIAKENERDALAGKVTSMLRGKGFSDEEIEALIDYSVRNYEAQQIQHIQDDVKNSGFAGKAAATIISTPMNLAGGLTGYADALIQRATADEDPFTGLRQGIDYNSRGQFLGNAATAIRSGVSADMGGFGSWLYNTGTSILDFGTAALTGQAELLLAGSAAQNALQEAHRNGASDDQALAIGLFSGIAEAAFEHLSVENLSGIKRAIQQGKLGGKFLARAIGLQSLTEGSEEGFTDIANLLTDVVINGDENQIKQAIRENMLNGMSEKDATISALVDQAKNIGLDVASGALSGLFTGGAQSAIGSAQYRAGQRSAEQIRQLAESLNAANADRQAIRDHAKENYGVQAKSVESVFEAGTADAETFQRQFQTAYDLGKSGAAMEIAMNTPATADLNELQRENAWAIGREAGIREGTIKEEANENVETVRVRGSGERDAGTSAAGSVQQVESSAGSYQEGRSLGIGRDAKDSGAAGFLYSDKVKSLRDYGVKNGAVIKNLYELSEESYEAAGLTEIKKEAEAHGYKLVAVAGLLHTQDAPGGWVTHSRGMVDEDTKTMFVQVDNVRFTASQIAMHEDGHTKIDRGEISLKATKEAVEKALSPEEYHQALQDYADAYYGIDMTEEQTWVEIVCDAQGDMNIFEGLGDRFSKQRERLGRVLEETKKASQETAREGETRAPPEGGQKMSAELPNVDSEGNALTEQQAAFFANSKVRTDSGALKVMYRGGNTDIEVFDRRKSKPSNLYGRGFYFTDSEAQAKQYGNATPYYLNITNPLSPGQHEITRAQMRAFLEAVQENDEDYDFVNYGQGASVSSVLSDLFGKGDMEMLQDVNATAIGDLVAAVELFNEVNGTDYDGIIVPTETVAFRSEQIKRTDNKKPTGNANVKFSRELEDAYMAAAEADDMREASWMVEAAAMDWGAIRGENGFPVKMYHGTGAFGFTVFDTSKSDDGISLFTTDNINTAKSYSGNTNRNRISEASTIDADSLGAEELLEEAKKHYKKYDDYRLLKGKEKQNEIEDMRAILEYHLEDANRFADEHGNEPDIFWHLNEALGKMSKAQSEDELQEAWDNWDAAVWELKITDEDLAMDYLEVVDSRGLFMTKNRLADFAFYSGNVYIDSWNSNYVFDNQLILEVNADLHKGVYELYGRAGRQLVIDAEGANWNAIVPPEELNLYGTQRTRDIATAAKAAGYDSIVFKNLRDNGGETAYNGLSNVYVFFNANQLKSADPVTYDDDGNVIPLSERFNPEQTDIRYSHETDLDQLARENRALQRETDELRKAVQKWRGETKRTTRATLREQDVRKAAKQMLRDYNSRADAESVSAKLRQLGELIMNGENGEAAHWSDVRGLAEEIAEEIVNAESVNVNGDEFENFQLLTGVLKEKPIHVSEADLNDILSETGYETIGAFNKAYRGTVRITTEAAKAGDKTAQDAYYEMVEAMPGWFPEDVSEAEYVPRMLQVLEGLKPIYGMSEQTSANYEAAVTWAANDVIDRVLDESIRQNPKTFADRAQAKHDKERARLYQRIRNVREQGNERVERTKREYTERSRKAIERMQARQEREIQRLKDRQREVRQNERERREEREGINKYRKRVEQKAKQLGDWLLKNSAKEHIPENLKKPVAEFLATIDFTSKRQLRGGAETQRDKRFAERLRALTSTLEKMQSGGAEDSLDSIRQHEGLPPYYMEFLKKLSEKTVTAMESGETYTINQMTAAELKTLDETITAVVKTIRMMNRLYENGRAANPQALGFETIEEMDKLGAKKASGERGDAVRSFFAWDNTNPFYAFKRLGSAAASVFEEIQNGWDRFAFNVIKIMDFTKEAYTSEEVRKWGNEVHEFELESGEKVYMTTAQIMSLRMLLRREQAVQHIQGGGVRIDDIDAKGKGNKHLQAEHYHLTAKDIEQITGTLTERQREVASALQKFMQQQGGEWGNHVSRARWDIDFFGEENYFPIVTEDSDRNAIDPEARANDLFRLLNMGATKSLNPNANNALVIRDIFDVFADHMTDMAKYDGLALPILDAMKWLNYRYREETSYDEETGKSEFRTHTVQRAIEKAYGKEALRYLTTFMRDLNGVNESTGLGEGFARKMISNYKVAAVAANLRVALLQPTSYFRALYAINGRYLARAIFAKPAVKECEKYSGMAAWKSLGYYDTNIARGVREQIKDSGGVKDKVQSASMKGAEWGDKLTWGALWNACKFAVKNERPGLDHEALMEATAKKFREVVYSTQVVDSTMTRSHNMRGKSLYGSMATAFMAEPTLSYNIVMDAVSEFQNEARRTNRQEAWKKSRGKVAKAFMVYCLSGLAASIAESIMDAFRDDDEYEKFYQKFLEAMLGEKGLKGRLNGNLANDLLIFNKLPLIKDALSLLSGYSTDRIDMEWMSNAIKAFGAIKEKIELDTGKLEKPTKTTYYGNMTWYGAVYLGLKTLSQATGLPVGSATREVVTLWNNTVGSMTGQKIVTYDSKPEKQIQKGFENGWLTEENAIRLLVDEGTAKDEDDAWFKVQKWSTGEGKFDAAVDAMLDGDKKAFNAAVKNLTAHGVKQKSVDSSMKSAIKKLYVGTDEEPSSISADRAKKLLQDYAGMKADEAAETITGWKAKLDTGYELGEVKEAYLDGDLSKYQVVDMRTKYAGDSQEDAEAYALRLDCEKEYGIEYGVQNVMDAVVDGSLTDKQAREIWKKYGGKDDEYIDKKLAQAEFVKQYPSANAELVNETSVAKFREFGEPTGIKAADFLQYWDTMSGYSADVDANGKTINGSKKQKVINYIASLPITSDQKTALYLAEGYALSKLPSW